MTKHAGSISLNTLFLCLASGLLLGISQPIYMPKVFGEVGGYQHWLGLFAFIGYVPFFWALNRSNLKASFLLTVFTLTVQYTVVLYWIYIALHVHGHIPSIFAGIITVLLPMILAIMAAVFFTIGCFLSQRFSINFFLFAPFALTAADYFRNYYLFGGFPWGNVGYSVGRIDQILQLASLIGVYGLVFFVGVVNSLIGMGFLQRRFKNLRFFGAALALVMLAFIYGTIRLHNGEHEFAKSIRVALLQGNIPQEMKSRAGLHANDILDIYLDLHKRAKAEGAELIIWPESSYPKMLDEDVSHLGFSFEERVASIIGVVVYGEEENGKDYHVRNSALLIDNEGRVKKRYDKSHLVPFGEYVPWPMSGIVDRIVPGMGAFKPGVEFVPEQLIINEGEKIAIGTTICYEGIFPEITRAYVNNGASLLVNLTNDAWYGLSSAPYQHFLMYRLRSVESGLTFLRATNTGITAWIDPYGRTHEKLSLFERGLMVDNVPLLKKPTLYAAVGDVIPIISLLFLIVGYVAAVLPIYRFFKLRQWFKLGLIVSLSAIVIFSHLYFSSPQFLTDESARTKDLFIFLFCLLLLIGALSESKRSRSILIVLSVVLVVCSSALAWFESPYFLFGVLFGLLIYLLAFRIKGHGKQTR